jgi:hypothetical protein
MNFNKSPIEYTQFDKNPLNIPGGMDFEKEAIKHLSQFENHIDEYNLPRIKDFLKSKGLDTDYSVFVLSKEDFENEENQSPQNGIDWNPLSHGEHIRFSRTLVVKIDTEIEKISGKLFTEGVIVHELAHRNSLAFYEEKQANNKVDIIQKRMGLEVYNEKAPNIVFEESFATMVQKTYMDLHKDSNQVHQLVVSNHQTDRANFSFKDYSYNIPSGLVFINQNRFGHFNPAYAYLILERLMKLNPNIETEIYNSRHSVDGIRKFIKEIEKIQKGLYVKIRNTPYEPNEMIKLLEWMSENGL